MSKLYPLSVMMVFGDRTLEEAIKVKRGSTGGALIQQGWCPYQR
jgi:hypothetical protein